MASSASTGATTAVSGGPQSQGFRQKISDFGLFLYNSEEGTVLGRNAKSWGQIGIFYLIYYSCLAGFFAAMIAAFYSTIDDTIPKLIGPDSLIRQNPGLGFRPIPDVTSTLVYVHRDKAASYAKYKENLEKYLSFYEDQTGVDCRGFAQRRPEGQWDQPCKIDMGVLGSDCTAANNFGYNVGKPCVLIKLNRVFDWQPQGYESNATVPDEIKNLYVPYHVTVKCEGENPADEDNIGQITYYPSGGFHYKYFPYQNQEGYRSPIVWARFETITEATMVMVNCKAYAKNIENSKQDKKGMVHFEVMVDRNPTVQGR